MGKIITSARLAAVTAGYSTAFNKIHQGAQTQWSKIASKTTSSSAKEIYGWLANTFGMKEVIGDVEIEDITTQDYELANKEFHDTKAVKRADLEDDKEGTYTPMFQMMGMGANRAYDEIVFARLSGGFTEKGYDGKAFFSATHPVGDKGKTTFSNLGTKKFSETNFSDALTALKTVKAANGKPWGFGQKLVLVCHPKHEVTVRKVLTLQKTAAGADNLFYNAAEVVSSALLNNEDSWFLLEVGWPVMPIILQEREGIKITSCNQPDDNYVLLNKKFLFQAYGRYNAGYGIPAMAWGSTGADAA
jgi:phage major head subunit gpT-like protein